MSTLSDILTDLQSLVSPSICLGCGKVLENRREWVCTTCHLTMPATLYHLDAENPMAAKVKSLAPQISNATALFYHINNGSWRELIHQIKYGKKWYLAIKLGRWYGYELSESPLYQDVDCIVPIPLHTSRRLSRGYNQSQKIGQGMAKAMGIRLESRAIKRIKNNESQVTRDSKQRWSNVSGIFRVVRPELLEGQHILLVDDVFTTGATLLSCAEEILRTVPTCRVSLATLSISSRFLPVHL